MRAVLVVLVLAASVPARGSLLNVSPVQKILSMLDECKAKTQHDLDAESKAMEKYTQFCDDEANAKKYAIETAGRQLEDLDAVMEDASATIASRTEEISELGNDIASMEGDLHKAEQDRNGRHEAFISGEKSLLATIEQLGQAITMTERAMKQIEEGGAVSDAPLGFVQISSNVVLQSKLTGVIKANLKLIMKTLSAVIEAEGIDSSSKAKLQSFLQDKKQSNDGDNDDDEEELAFAQNMMRPLGGGPGTEAQDALKNAGVAPKPPTLSETLDRMRGQAESKLVEMRKKESEDQHSFNMIKQGIQREISHTNSKLSTATADKAASTQSLENAKAKKGETAAAKAADEDLQKTLQMECQTKAREWEERMRSARGEMGAIDKAKEILAKGVKVFVQVQASTRSHAHGVDSDGSPDDETALRKMLTDRLRSLAQSRHSFALSQLTAAAASDPLKKVRLLIEGMIEKVTQQAAQAATKEAFCQEEIGKNTKKQEEKGATADKHKTRMDSASTTMAELTFASKTLTSELAEIDSSQAEATQIRSEEKAEYKQASGDYRQTSEAVAKAIDVLKSYYEGAALMQVKEIRQPAFGGNQGDASSGIIALLELVQQDSTALLTETESTETEAAQAFDKLSKENRLSRAAKVADVRGKESEVKSLKVQLSHSKEDYDSVAKELDAVNEYLARLKPECQGSAMSYTERKAAREAEISGLKEALGMLDGGVNAALAQTSSRLRSGRRA